MKTQNHMTKQILPVAPGRNAEGYWTHSHYPIIEDGTPPGVVANAFSDAGISHWDITEMQHDIDLDHPAHDRYFGNGNSDIHDWNPKPPKGEGWFLLSIHDSEEGPVAVFGKREGSSQPVTA